MTEMVQPGKPLIHLVCGPTGAGKTTYAAWLARDLDGVRFSIDEWMSALFWIDLAGPIEPVWAMERVRRCSEVMFRTACEVARTGTPCILEIGLTTRQSRSQSAARAREAGYACRLHLVDVDAQERWRRVQARNADAGDQPQLGFAITREMFDYVETMWEPPTDEELAAFDGVRVNGAP